MLQAEIRDVMATLATPVEQGRPLRAHIAVVSNEAGRLRYQAFWGRDAGRQREWFGPIFEYPREAIRFVADVNARSGLGTWTPE
jgi:hypothetical protein